MLKGFFGVIGGLFSLLTLWKRGKEREKDREAGQNKANLRHAEGNLEASREMREIENEVEGLPDAARRDLARSFVRGDKVRDKNDDG